jgi:hypothetical protein
MHPLFLLHLPKLQLIEDSVFILVQRRRGEAYQDSATDEHGLPVEQRDLYADSLAEGSKMPIDIARILVDMANNNVVKRLQAH